MANRCTGTACIEAKLLQQLSKMIQTTLHFIFLDLWMLYYDTVNRERLLEIQEGYGVGPNVLGLLKFYWDHQRFVAKCRKYHKETFLIYRGATQGGVVSPTLCNLLVGALVQKWWTDIIEDMTTANSGLQGNIIGHMSSLFYADDGAIGSKDHELLKNVTQHLCNLFRDSIGLKQNTEKTETMSCHSGTIWERCSMKSYKRRHKGTGETYSKRKRKRTMCPSPSCGKDLVLVSIQSHFCT